MYNQLSKELQERILEDRERAWVNPYAFKDENIIRRNPDWDKATILRPAFVRDIQKIMNFPHYNRYSDKTQVFSFFKNDDISRRAYHVQLVSQTARNIGRLLGLNESLIEAMALGHDIGHTPFGHEGERQLSQLYHDSCGKYFNHNVHSVRVLDRMVHWNISLQVLDGILCHNGEMEKQEYRPCVLKGFEELDKKVDGCYEDMNNIAALIPSTLEGCVVRISDIIAYIGKDRQDAEKLGMLKLDFGHETIGGSNAEIINNLTVNIVENSYGKPYISMEPEYFDMLTRAKKENGQQIYKNSDINNAYKTMVKPMMERMYERLLGDVLHNNRDSIIYKHHVSEIKRLNSYSYDKYDYEDVSPDDLVVDYIASMTDDYFVDLYEYLFGVKSNIQYIGYFDNL